MCATLLLLALILIPAVTATSYEGDETVTYDYLLLIVFLVPLGIIILTILISHYRLEKEIGSKESMIQEEEEKRIKTENALKKQETKYFSLMNRANDAIYIADADTGEIKEANSRMDDLLGREIQGSHYKEIYPAEEYEKNSGIFSGNVHEEGAIINTFVRHTNGHYIPVEMSINVISVDEKRYKLVVMRDTSEKRLSGITLDRTTEKYRDLFRVTSYDAMNMVTALKWYLHLAESGESEEERLEYLNKAVKTTDSMRNLLENIQKYPEIYSKSAEWQSLKDAFVSGSADFDLSGYKIENNIRDMMIFSDPNLDLVFARLISNTIMHAGSADTIRLSTEECDKGLKIIYEDNGTGIPEEEKEKIFLHGYGKFKGYGLSSVREILSVTGIMIRETGKGHARFEILVPWGQFRYL